MTKKNLLYTCKNCGAQFSKWNGRCLECGGWGTLEEGFAPGGASKSDSIMKAAPTEVTSLAEVRMEQNERIMTGIGELDRVLGGGLVPGSLTLLAGEPGIGKSTLLAQMVDALSKKLSRNPEGSEKRKHVLYVSGEESAPQVRDRFSRLNCDLKLIFFANEVDVERIQATVLKERPDLLIIDSIQTMRSTELPSEAGSVSQIRAATVAFLEIAKKYGISVVITGHITKDGQVAGPKTLEHIVDTVIYLEHDQSMFYRLLRSTKNRFGSVNEIGIFEMTGQGFKEVKNPSLVFMDEARTDIAGAAVSCLLEGTRSFLVEVQALVTRTVFGYPQRKATGIDTNRLQLLAAVLEKRAGLRLSSQDIILNVVGGLKTKETALDMAVCASIISSLANKSVGKQDIFLGEVGLGGEIRNIGKLNERLHEASRLGFTKAYIPNTEVKNNKIKLVKIKNLGELNKILLD